MGAATHARTGWEAYPSQEPHCLSTKPPHRLKLLRRAHWKGEERTL